MTGNLESTLRSTISHGALSAGIALSLTAIADHASAQQTQGQGSNVVLDTVEVETQNQVPPEGEGAYAVQSASSPKQTAPLLDTPQTVTVVPQAVIQETGSRTLTEVLRNTPGISFDAGENGFATSPNNFKIRGFDSSGSVFIDGSRDNGSYARDTFNLERVEVFKGAAADNGRGGAGGYVNLVTKSPILENFVSGEIGFGFDEYDSKMRKRATTDINYMVAPNIGVRLNGMWEDGGIAGREVVENNAWGFAPSITFGLGTHARATFAYEHLTRKDLPDWGFPAHAIKGMARFDPVVGTVARDTFYGLRSDFDNVDADAVIARFEYDFSPTSTISNQTRWARVDRTARFTTFDGNPFAATPLPATPGSLIDTQTLFYDRENTTLTNLTNYSTQFFTGTFKHNMSMGVELSREESDAARFGSVDAGATGLFDPNPDRRPGAPFISTQSARVKVETAAAYLYDTIELNRQWELTGGIRAEHYKVNLRDDNPAPNAVGSFSTSESTLGGKIGIVYKPVENGSFYASAGISHRPPGSYLSSSDISRTGNNAFPGLVPDADPVRSINYEVGTKWDFFGGRLQATAALFQTEQRVPLMPGATIFYSDEVVRGLELGIAGNVTENWKVFGGVVFLDSERKASAALDAALIAASPNDFVGLDGTVYTSVNGDELAFTPKISASLWTTYLVPSTRWTVGGGMQYVGSSWLGRPDDANRVIPNGVFGKLPGYFLAHLMASYEIYQDVHLRFNVDNVFDKKYALTSNWPGQRVFLGAPRTYRVSASFRY